MITHTGQSLIPIFPHLSLSSARWSIDSSCFPLTGMSKSSRTVSQMSKSLFRYLRTLTTWYCPHSSAAAAEIDRHLLPTGHKAANRPHAAEAGERDRQTGRRTDTVPFHKPYSAYYAGSASEVTTLLRYTNLFIIIIFYPR